MSLNYLILSKQIKFSDLKIKKDVKLKLTLKKPHIFQHIMTFLDDETIYEINWVCKQFSKSIKNQMELHYKVLSLKDEKNKKKKKKQKEFFESVETSRKATKENKHILTLFLKSTIPQYGKFMIDISKTNSKEKKETEKNLIKGDQDLEEFFEIFQKNLEEAERRKRKEEELNMSLELHKKDNSNGYIIYQPVPGVLTNNYANSIFNIVKESGTAKLFLNIDPFELYYNLEKIFDKIDEKMFDFDMMVAECLFKLKYRFKIKELSFKSLK